MNYKLLLLLLNAFVLTIPSLIIGLISWLLNYGFIVPSLISMVLIWIIGIISNKFIEKKTEKEILQLKNLQLKMEEQYIAEVFCAYCSQKNHLKISLNSPNEYFCKSCNQKNSVTFTFSSFRTTEPITDAKHNEVIKQIIKKAEEEEEVPKQ